MPGDALSITDNRTGKTYEFPITEGELMGFGHDIRDAVPMGKR